MTEIGLFPLGIVLLPTERVPLHIFEPRYKELIGECLDEEREFGLMLTDDEGLREIGTCAAVEELLELRSEPARLRRLAQLLERAAKAIRLEHEVRTRAGGNGRVSIP